VVESEVRVVVQAGVVAVVPVAKEAGGSTASNVTLNVTGGRVESDGSTFLERGTTTTVSSTGVIEGQNVVLGSSLGTTITAVTGANSLLKSRGSLTAGRAGASTLSISAGAKPSRSARRSSVSSRVQAVARFAPTLLMPGR
jgi:T5SS/PEP-CTERM-associated repeat protein